MRRSASNTGRRCSPASDSMCAHSRGELGAGGMDALARRLEQRRRRRLREPVDLEPGPQAAQLARDREVAPRVPEADRRRDEEGALRSHGRPAPGRRRRGRQQELAQQQVDAHRVARVGRVAAALERDQPAARLGRAARRRWRAADAILVAVEHEHGAAHAARECTRLRRRRGAGRRSSLIEQLRRSCRAPIRGRTRSAASSAAPGRSRRRTTRRSPRSRAARHAGCSAPSPRTRAARRRMSALASGPVANGNDGADEGRGADALAGDPQRA